MCKILRIYFPPGFIVLNVLSNFLINFVQFASRFYDSLFFNCRIVICLFGVLVCCSTVYELYLRYKSGAGAVGYDNKAFEAIDDKTKKDIQLIGVNTISHDAEKNKTASDPVVQREMNGTAAVVVQQEDQLQLNTERKKGIYSYMS